MKTDPGQTIVYEISEAGFGDAIEIRQIVRLLELHDDTVRTNLDDNDAGMASSFVRNSLLARLVLLVSRAYARSKDTDLHIRRAICLLRDDAVRDEIETWGPPGSLANALVLWSRLRSDHRLPLIVHFRDKFTAHLGQPDPSISLPQNRQVFDFAMETSNMMSALAIATGAKPEGVDTWDGEIEQAAAAFWSPWRSGAK
ncbi:MAG: hypothetical protein JWR09_5801 [Mucilaginibacter sp.]|nr:hypothetical protein [Mucilaginibacter sp.]